MLLYVNYSYSIEEAVYEQMQSELHNSCVYKII